MEIKSNDATPLRPEGDRILNAPVVEMNLNEFKEQIKSESAWQESDRNSVTIFKSEIMTIVLIGLRAQAELKPHKADGLLTITVVEGSIEFISEQKECTVKTNQMIAVQKDIFHSVKAVKDSFLLLTQINKISID